MRSVASVYSDTRNEKLYCTLDNIIKDMFTVAENDGCVSTDDRENEFQAWDIWCRKYVLLGMLHFYDICRSEDLKSQILEFFY